MINNNLSNLLNRFYNRSNGNNAGGSPADVMQRLKQKRDAQRASTQPVPETAEKDGAAAAESTKPKTIKDIIDSYTKSKNPAAGAKETAAAEEEASLSPEEKRQKALQKILEKIEAEEAAKYPSRAKQNSKSEASAQTDVTTVTDPAKAAEATGVEGFLNDLPLFNEFKASLMDAFKRMDSGAAGSISAQYELNYSSMQYIANAAGGFDYEETNFSIKFDLNYIKAASGGKSGQEIADAIDQATDFESLMNNLEEIGKGMAAQEPTKGIPELKNMKPEDFLGSMKDYFSPEKTAGRIVDFATAFFPLSDAFKKAGDTEEARKEFSEMMGKAIQKGFDQALGTLGSIPKSVKDGVDKTHELTFKGLEDFVKNGMDRNKQDNGTYNALQELSFSFEMNYSKKTVSVRNGGTYGANGEARDAQSSKALDTQA